MKVKIISLCVLLSALILLPIVISTARACEPQDGDAPNSRDGCRVTLPSNRASPSLVVVSTPKSEAASASNSAAALNATSNPQPLACLMPDGESATNALGVVAQCSSAPVQIRAVKILPTPVPVVKAIQPTAVPNQPKGDAPQSAKTASDKWETLEAGGMLWYKFDNGNNFYLNVWLDAYGKSGINFAMFAPNQSNGLNQATSPKGRGAPSKNDPSHDLFWAGSQASGTWYALVTNYNSVPVQYKIGYQQSTEERNCWSYWEWIKQDYVYWTQCK